MQYQNVNVRVSVFACACVCACACACACVCVRVCVRVAVFVDACFCILLCASVYYMKQGWPILILDKGIEFVSCVGVHSASAPIHVCVHCGVSMSMSCVLSQEM